MSSNYSQKAIELAKRDYPTLVILDNADGEDGYIAINPQFEGCMSQGDTPQEALENLLDARTLYIETLLEEKAQVPEPPINSNIHITSDLVDFSGNILKNDDTIEMIEDLEFM